MHSPLSFCKNASPTFSIVHLLHRLYGVDAPGARATANRLRLATGQIHMGQILYVSVYAQR